MTRPDIPVSISGDPRKFEDALKRMRAATRTTASDLTASFLRFKEAIAGPAAAGAAVIAGLTAAIKTSVESVAELSRQARMSGIDVERFQELKFAAEQNRIGVDILADGLKELSLRADEFVQTGGGGAAESFQRLGYSSDELAKKLQNPSELFVEIIGRMQEFDRAARLRLGDELFGGSAGERFVELVDKGAEGLRNQIALANDLGVVMSRDVVSAAEDVDRMFNQIANTIGTKVNKYINEALLGWLRFVDKFNEFEGQQTTNVQGALVKTYQDIEAAKNRLEELQKTSAISPVAQNLGFGETKNESLGINKDIEVAQKNLDDLTNKALQLRDILDRRNGMPAADAPPSTPPAKPRDLSGDYMRDYREGLAATNRERKVAAELEKILSDASSHGVKLTKDQAEALANETVARQERDEAAKKSASASERAATASEKDRERIREVISELEKEIAVVWKGEAAKRALEASRMAGADATDAERQKIIQLNEVLFQQEEARQRVLDQVEFERDMVRSALQDMKSALDDGKITWKELGDIATNVLSRISDKILDDVVDSVYKLNGASGSGGGILSAIFGGIFGGGKSSGGGVDIFREKGGPVAKGRPYVVGEKRPELFVPDQSGTIVPHVPDFSPAQSSTSASFTFAPQIDARGASVEAVGRLEQVVQKQQQDFYSNVLQAMRKAKRSMEMP